MFTTIFLSFHSETHIYRVIKQFKKKYPIIIVENSLNKKVKSKLEKKYKNIKVIIPKKNLGISAGYNLGIKKSKTNLVYLSSPDTIIDNKNLQKLENCVSKIKDFSIFAPTYYDEKIYKNYDIIQNSKLKINNYSKYFKKYKIKQVSLVDNNFIINKKKINKLGFFDENIFMYYETMDFSNKISLADKKIYVSEKIKFKHLGSESTNNKFKRTYDINRSWHYNWSKFYYFKKNHSYLFALKKILPNLLRALKNIILNSYKKNNRYNLHLKEIQGIISSIFLQPSKFRPFNKNEL
jgi:N-acetylglucosaminyl-diphospho-decaprenol L-rhamnosyltransferase